MASLMENTLNNEVYYLYKLTIQIGLSSEKTAETSLEYVGDAG